MGSSTMAGTNRSLRGLRDGFGFGEGFSSQESDAGSTTADNTPTTTPISRPRGGLAKVVRRVIDHNRGSPTTSPGVRSNGSAEGGRYKFVSDKRSGRRSSDTIFYEPDQYNSKMPNKPEAHRTQLVKKRKRS